MKIYTKKSFIEALQNIAKMGWIENCSTDIKAGGLQNTIEQLLDINRTKFALSDAVGWELKIKTMDKLSSIPLWTCDPMPKTIPTTSSVLLSDYGWKKETEKRKGKKHVFFFKQAIQMNIPNDRGFSMTMDKTNKRVLLAFNYQEIADKYTQWARVLKSRHTNKALNPQPYWLLDELGKGGEKNMQNYIWVEAERKNEINSIYYKYSKIKLLQNFSVAKFLQELEKGTIQINFRMKTSDSVHLSALLLIEQNSFPNLFSETTVIL
jgi:hypothetical protein